MNDISDEILLEMPNVVPKSLVKDHTISQHGSPFDDGNLSIFLKLCGLSDDDVIGISEHIKCWSLTEVNFSGNQLTIIGALHA